MFHASLPVLFESSDFCAVVDDPVNQAWVAVMRAIEGPRFDRLARRYYQALQHFRKRPVRSALPGTIQLQARSRQQAFEGMLSCIEKRKVARKRAEEAGEPFPIFVDAWANQQDESLPRALRDFSVPPLPLDVILDGPGRPPCDALCLLRAFLAAPLLIGADGPTAVHRLLHSNPAFAELAGFCGRGALKQAGELTSRRLPSEAVCEEFSEVMTRYGLWQLCRIEQVQANIARGAVLVQDTVAVDTTHIVAYSHCGNVVPKDAVQEDGKEPKHRKVPRVRKACDCGRAHWQTCEHPWTPTDHGAAVVVKGPSRIYWAHKASIAVFADSEIPFDVRVLQYAADSDGKTLLPHLEELRTALPVTLSKLEHILADDAYREHAARIEKELAGVRLTVPVHPRRVCTTLAAVGIDHFTPTGLPVCTAGHRFDLRGRDLGAERYIFAAPDDETGRAVCTNCPLPVPCTRSARRHIRVDRSELPQLDWDHPQHFARNRVRYGKRTAVERAIKRLKVDLGGETLTHRDALRVQAHLDRKLLTLHLLLAINAST